MTGSNERLLKVLTVETLRVYNYILKHNPSEVTLDQLSSGLNLTKPTVFHHLDKLKTVDLIESTQSGYKVKEVVRVAIIKGYTRLFERLLVSWVPLIFIFFGLAIASVLFITQIQYQVMAIFLCILGIVIALREIKRIW